MNTILKTGQTDETSEQFTLMKSPPPIYSLEDFHVQLSALLGDEQGSEPKMQEVLSFLRSVESSLASKSHMYSLKTLRDFSTTTTEEHLQLSSQVWMNWGMTCNGNVLTAKISESHRIGKEYLLSDILEDTQDQKYFLSEEAMQKIAFKTEKNKALNRGFGAKVISPLEQSVTEFTREILTTSTLTQALEERLDTIKANNPIEETEKNQMDFLF